MNKTNYNSSIHDDDFIYPKIRLDFLDKYVVRSSILTALKDVLPLFSGKLLDLGAGHQPYKNLLTSGNSKIDRYYPLDIAGTTKYPGSEYEWDGIQMPFENDLFDCVIATEVFEHCPSLEITLSEINRVLKPGGILFFTVPFVWPLHDCPNDEYRYTPFSLERHLYNARFKEVSLKPTGGWDATLAQVLGLWLRRRPMKSAHRTILSKLFLPFYKWLVKKDLPVSKFSHECYIMPGISGIASKSRD